MPPPNAGTRRRMRRIPHLRDPLRRLVMMDDGLERLLLGTARRLGFPEAHKVLVVPLRVFLVLPGPDVERG